MYFFHATFHNVRNVERTISLSQLDSSAILDAVEGSLPIESLYDSGRKSVQNVNVGQVALQWEVFVLSAELD